LLRPKLEIFKRSSHAYTLGDSLSAAVRNLKHVKVCAPWRTCESAGSRECCPGSDTIG